MPGPLSTLLDRVAYRWLAVEDRRLERRLGVETAGSVELDELTVDAEHQASGFAYVASPGRLVDVVVAQAPGPLATTTFVDLGSGKGRVVTRAALHPFRRVVGVEFVDRAPRAWPWPTSPRSGARGRRSRRSTSSTWMPRGFEFPDGDVLAYFNNPFDESVMRPVVAGLEAAIRRGGRVTAVYQQARVEDDPTDNLAILRASPVLLERPPTDRRPARSLAAPAVRHPVLRLGRGALTPDEHRPGP